MGSYHQFQGILNNLNIYFLEKDKVVSSESCLKVFFISYGNTQKRAKVFQVVEKDFAKAWKRTENFLSKLYEKEHKHPDFLKIDYAFNIENIPFSDLQQQLKDVPHNNHFRKGISFDKNFEVSFLEQELYGSGIIRGDKIEIPSYLDQNNLNSYLKYKYPHKIDIKLDELGDSTILLFNTHGIYIENNNIIPLQSEGARHGIREIPKTYFKSHIKTLIEKNSAYLHDQILDNGQLVYGYYPIYNKILKGYNSVRHCTSVYALIESLEVSPNECYFPKIHNAINYALNHLYTEVTKSNQTYGYILDGAEHDKEIKLGANAAAILMITKYYELTQDKQYLQHAINISKGILSMVSSEGETTHVLSYPSLEIKEKFRIVYYDGEAALALLRLYQITQQPELLHTVEAMFEHFIKNNYWKHHDHWLSYCTNELTMIKPERKYFEFGINNYIKNMTFIRNRKTAYATFLEMLMAAYKMVTRMQAHGFDDLMTTAKFEALCELIEYRAEYQRTGFFYPEMSMYFGAPEKILHAFFVRHDRFRTRIDDSEHNLSGYIAYYQHFKHGIDTNAE